MTVAEVRLWGRTIGAASWDDAVGLAHFEYDPDFRSSGIQVAPLVMPLSDTIHSYPALPRKTFYGLPGLLADSLPDDFGNALIDAWLAREGRGSGTFNPVERLCYTGTRGMGALEYHPLKGPRARTSEPVDVKALVELAGEILAKRGELAESFAPEDRGESLKSILRVGTSAGGARAKAVIAWNPETNEVRSGQVSVDEGFTPWILKFDGVSGSGDHGISDPKGYGKVEYAYHLMARAAGITMTDCRLLEENGRCHFMTRRFDRTTDGGKLHMQSLGALAHFDYRKPGAYSYEQALRTIRALDLPMAAVEEQFRRMAFNIVARNQDDHVKNIAFLMDRAGSWSLSPAFDVIYAYNPDGPWTTNHQMSLNGKTHGFTIEDFRACATGLSMARGRAEAILEEVAATVAEWPAFAAEAGVDEVKAGEIGAAHRMSLID